jgi:hypothetical protein
MNTESLIVAAADDDDAAALPLWFAESEQVAIIVKYLSQMKILKSVDVLGDV